MRSIALRSVEEPGVRWSIPHRQKRGQVKQLPLLRRGEPPGTHLSPERNPMSLRRVGPLRGAAARGALAGLAGAAAMTAAEKMEQAITGRPNSYVPARALLTLLGRRPGDDACPPAWNHAMHWGTGALLGALRGMWSVTGIRGTEATVTHTVVRLAFDQTVENATGVGAPPSSWPRSERVVDVAHKAMYSLVTGAVADGLLAPTLEIRRGIKSH
jgi:hypothetical protein